jgi:glutamate--cysteine ligase
MYEGGFGLEKESLRVDICGCLAHTPHPFINNPNIDRDFCENQTELITNVCNSAEGAWNHLAKLHKTVVRELLGLKSGKEFLWPFSNPPYVKGEDDIPIANFRGELHGKELYRHYLAEKYGKKKMLFSGIHFNFSFAEEILAEGYRQSGCGSYFDYKNQLYLELAKKVTKYSWLIVYLTAASSVMDGSFFDDNNLGESVLPNYSSVRCGKVGYWNDFIPLLEYDGSLNAYVQSIQEYIDNGQLSSVSELYYPVRLKPSGENSLENLENNGIDHIELRMIDLNPLSPIGLMKEDVIFLHLLIIYLASLEDEKFTISEQVSAIKNIKRAAEYDDECIKIELGWNDTRNIKEAAANVLNNMEAFFARPADSYALRMIEFQKNKVAKSNKRYAAAVRERYKHNYVMDGLALAQAYAEEIEKEIAQNV